MNDKELTIKHLKFLRDGIKGVNEKHDIEFNIERYAQDIEHNYDIEPEKMPHHCGTSACALGHAPLIDGIPKPDGNENWDEYSDRIFPYISDFDNRYWQRLFGKENPNCIDAFIKRANRIIKELE